MKLEEIEELAETAGSLMRDPEHREYHRLGCRFGYIRALAAVKKWAEENKFRDEEDADSIDYQDLVDYLTVEKK